MDMTDHLKERYQSWEPRSRQRSVEVFCKGNLGPPYFQTALAASSVEVYAALSAAKLSDLLALRGVPFPSVGKPAIVN